MIMFAYFGTTSFAGVFASMTGGQQRQSRPRIGLLLLLGACGKSGQFPLQTWLPDAMEGPTPGVGADPRRDHGHRRRLPDRAVQSDLQRLAVRSHRGGGRRRHHACCYGCYLRASRQDDLKQVLAYSTVSQIGYMFLAVGLGQGGYTLRHHPPARPWLLQGRPVPLGRRDHARHERPHQHAKIRRPVQGHADHLLHVPVRISRHHRVPVRHGLLHQRQDHRGDVRQGWHIRRAARLRRAPWSRPDGVLHDARPRDDILRRASLGGRRAPARGQTGHDRADGHPGHLSLVGGFLLTVNDGGCRTGWSPRSARRSRPARTRSIRRYSSRSR